MVDLSTFRGLFCTLYISTSATAEDLDSRVLYCKVHVDENFHLPSIRFGLKASFTVKIHCDVIEVS